MATIKLKFHPSAAAHKEGKIYYQVFHERKSCQLLTSYKIYPDEWDKDCSFVKTTKRSERNSFILSIRENIRRDIERFNKIIRNFDKTGLTYSASDVIVEFNRYTEQYSLFHFMENIINKLKQNGKVRTSETYTVTLNSFKKFISEGKIQERFSQNQNIMMDSLNAEVLEAYEAWHQQRGVTPNTISFYTRILRAVYNRAVEQDIIENRNPFKHVYTGIDKTVKRALPLTVIRKINSLDLSLIPALDHARDMFIMSFMLRGMSFIDMAFLRKSDLVNGYITYRRRKTGQLLTIKWTKEMQNILEKYPENRTPYLLPIIRNSGSNERYAYRNMGYSINHNLKIIAQKVGINIPLTLYVARHSWASAAKAQGIPLSVISEGMGHDSETTTQIYLASLDTSVVDKANSMILSSL